MIWVFINLLTFMWLESAFVVFCTEKWWKLGAKFLPFPFLFSSWSEIFSWHFSHWDLKKDWSYVMKYTCWDVLKKRVLEGRGYGIDVEFWFYGRKPRERSREKNLKICVQDGRSVMTIRVGDCVGGIPDDALEVFNIVGIGLKKNWE